MPSRGELLLRFEVIPREPIVISGEGFPKLQDLSVYSRCVPQFTFQEGAMPMLTNLWFKFQFYGGPPADKDPPVLGIKHLLNLVWGEFRCSKEWYGGAAESMSAMIDVVRKEAQEHPNRIYFRVSGREDEKFEESAQASSSGTSKIDDTPNSGSGEIQEEEETFPRNESGKVSGSGMTGEIQGQEEEIQEEEEG